nr:hypothetical protein [Lactococcus cremoris]
MKKGRSVDYYCFHITKKRRADDNSYKLEDKTYQEAKAEKEAKKIGYSKSRCKSKYLVIAGKNSFISPYEMTDPESGWLAKKCIQSMTNSKHYEDLRGSRSTSHTFGEARTYQKEPLQIS